MHGDGSERTGCVGRLYDGGFQVKAKAAET